jgi:tRNA modification GTPase
MNIDHEDTIAAIATPPGRSALGIIRISGKNCISILPEIFIPSKQKAIRPFHPTLGRLLLEENQYVDEAVLTFFQAPRSYTREDLAEITCHGNPLIIDRVLERLIRSGARLALPGEFTFRAFLNGRLDLVQAEAVQDLISADSLNQVELALQQMDGRLSIRFRDVRKKFVDLISLMEGNIDFSEEQHYHFIDHNEALRRNEELLLEIRELLGTFEKGRLIREGFQLVITGRPNVGKSSLFNYLLGENRAIVTPSAGTTRDYLKERLMLKGQLVHLLDTAGIRESFEEIEREGIERSKAMIGGADLVLFVVDGSEDLKEEDFRLFDLLKGKDAVVVSNKSDTGSFREHRFQDRETIAVSALRGNGMQTLLNYISNQIECKTKRSDYDFLVSSVRHRNLLRRASEALERSREALKAGLSEELVLIDVHDAMLVIGEITGEVTMEDIYQHIFSSFCIGK